MGSHDSSNGIDWQAEALRWREEALSLRSLVEELRTEVAALREENAKLRAENAELNAKVTGLEQQNEQLLRRVLGPTSEKMTPIDRELRRKLGKKTSGKKRRKENAAARTKLETKEVEHPVADDQRQCPNCGIEMRAMPPEQSVDFEYVPAKIIRRVHLREKLSCRACGTIVTAPPPPKAYDKARYGPRLIAHIITAKCADVLPLYRQAKQLARLGIPIARSTLTDLFHRAAGLLAPLVDRMEQIVAQSSHVLADETSFRIQDTGACRRGFIWTFIGSDLILYRYSADRSGETPQRVLGGTAGKLLVDGYTGYNHVCAVDGRDRAGCLCHMRRYFFEALGTAPEQARHALDVVLDLYMVEREAMKAGVLGTDEHLRLRRQKSRPIMEAFRRWLDQQKPRHPPKSPIAQAIGYAINQWEALTQFLDDPALPPDNNESERRLRLIAQGRRSYLFAAADAGAENLATLMSLVVTCEAHEIDPDVYLADVLIRMQSHPQSRIDELLPPNWKALRGLERSDSAAQRPAAA
jgi:transposase